MMHNPRQCVKISLTQGKNNYEIQMDRRNHYASF